MGGCLPALRAGVLAHVAGCEDCARVWNDLQKAQELVLNLPVHTTSRDVRQTLWARIESGEGSPEIHVRRADPLARGRRANTCSWARRPRHSFSSAATCSGRTTRSSSSPIRARSSPPHAYPRRPETARAPSASATERVAAGVPAASEGAGPVRGDGRAEPVGTRPGDSRNHAARNVRALRSRLCDDRPPPCRPRTRSPRSPG
jgi:hypothetical protein